MTRPILISEVFGPTIQGEGAQLGRPTVFVRTAGCDYRCSWCDTPYAVLPTEAHKATWQPMTAEQIMGEVWRLTNCQPCLITLSGGNPALQPLEPLLDLGHQLGYTFTMETQGSVYRPWFAKLDHLTISPKPPSSGMVTNWDRLRQCLAAGCPDTSLKVVVFDDRDYRYARDVGATFADVRLFLSVGNHTPNADEVDTAGLLDRLRWLVETIVADGWYSVTITPQLHVLIWGNTRAV